MKEAKDNKAAMQQRWWDPKYHTDEAKLNKEAMQWRQQNEGHYDKELIQNKMCIKSRSKMLQCHIRYGKKRKSKTKHYNTLYKTFQVVFEDCIYVCAVCQQTWFRD